MHELPPGDSGKRATAAGLLRPQTRTGVRDRHRTPYRRLQRLPGVRQPAACRVASSGYLGGRAGFPGFRPAPLPANRSRVSWWDLLLRPFTTVPLRRGLPAAAMTCLLVGRGDSAGASRGFARNGAERRGTGGFGAAGTGGARVGCHGDAERVQPSRARGKSSSQTLDHEMPVPRRCSSAADSSGGDLRPNRLRTQAPQSEQSASRAAEGV